jgi:thioredoxin reductase/ferredoxin
MTPLGSIIYAGFGTVVFLSVRTQLRRYQRQEQAALAAARRVGLATDGPRAQHPHIDVSGCIGCGACVGACPEGDVLAVVGGKAALVHPHKCIGHGLCAEACPVGAIEIVMAKPTMTADLPTLTEEMESSVPNLFIAGELTGLALIKNAINQGARCVDVVARRAPALRRKRLGEVVDVAIVGAGPAGLSASLRAVELRLTSVTLEAEEFGGTVARYPRQKLVMTSPVTVPLVGQVKKLEFGKEDLLAFWKKAVAKAGLQIRTRERVEGIERDQDGVFTLTTSAGRYRALAVILAIGRRGNPRKLGIPGEELPKVMYSLLDAEAYTGKRIVVVGGGDSAVEAALGLAHQRGNQLTLSYRKDVFSRLKDRNEQRLREMMRGGHLTVLFNSEPIAIRPASVLLKVAGGQRELANDYVWIFAGGTPPNVFLEQAGVQLGMHDLAAEVAVARREVA